MSTNMRISNTSERLKEYLVRNNKRQIDIVNACQPYAEKYGVRIGKSDISAYIHGIYLPAQDKLAILSMALNVSEAWLMGYDVTPNRTDIPSANSAPWSVRFRDAICSKMLELDNTDFEAASINAKDVKDILENEKALSFEKACELADAFGLSIDDEVLELNAPTQQDERTSEVIRLFAALDQEHQETLIQVLRGLLADQKTGRGSPKKAD